MWFRQSFNISCKTGFKVYVADISNTGIEITKHKAKELNLNNIEFKQHVSRQTFEKLER